MIEREPAACSSEHGENSVIGDDCYFEAESSDAFDHGVTFGNVDRELSIPNDSVDKSQPVGAARTHVSQSNDGNRSTFRNDAVKDNDIYDAAFVNEEGVITSPSSSGRRFNSRFVKTHTSDRVTEDSSKRGVECATNSRELHKQSAVLGSYNGSVDLDIFLSKYEVL